MTIKCLQFVLALTFSLLTVYVTAYNNVRRDTTNLANNPSDYFDVGVSVKRNKHDKKNPTDKIHDLKIRKDDKVTNNLEHLLKTILLAKIMEEWAKELKKIPPKERVKSLGFEFKDSDVSGVMKLLHLKRGKKPKDKRKSKHTTSGKKIVNSKFMFPLFGPLVQIVMRAVGSFSRIIRIAVDTARPVINAVSKVIPPIKPPKNLPIRPPQKLPAKQPPKPKPKPGNKPTKPKNSKPSKTKKTKTSTSSPEDTDSNEKSESNEDDNNNTDNYNFNFDGNNEGYPQNAFDFYFDGINDGYPKNAYNLMEDKWNFY